jgi:transposase-like protein
MVFEHQAEHESQWAAIVSIAGKIGCTPESLRQWVRQAERDQGKRAGLTSTERERLKQLERFPPKFGEVISSSVGAKAASLI